MKLKICGIKTIDDALIINEIKPDFFGFVFANSSRKISFETAKVLRERINREIKSVGVFLNEEINTVVNTYENGIIDIVQLHGDEDNSYIKKLKSVNIVTIKAINFSNLSYGLKNYMNYPNTDYLLFDGSSGGKGISFDWTVLDKLKIEKPFFLSGGINEKNLVNLDIKVVNPYAIDVSSGVETNGCKDKDKIMRIKEIVKGVNL